MSKKIDEDRKHGKELRRRGLSIKNAASRAELEQLKLKRKQQEVELLASDEYRIMQIAKEQRFEKEKWYKLDNAGLIYPAMYLKGFNPNFTITVILNEKVDPIVLQKAVNLVVPRFAPITTALKKGIFWYYLGVPKPLTIENVSSSHTYTSVIDGKSSMTRVTYFGNELSVSVFHSASDANGTLIMLNSILAKYFEFLGHSDIDKTNRLDYRDIIQPYEVSDTYHKIATKEKLIKDDEKNTYQIKGTKLSDDTLLVVKGIMKASKVHSVAKSYGITVTQLFNACLLYAINIQRDSVMDKSLKPAAICSAVNLRKFFPTQSLRNFASYISTTDEGEKTLEGLFKVVKKQYEEKLKPEYFLARVNFNVKSQKNFFVKVLPLPLKNFVLGLGYNIFGKRARTMTLSNLGTISAPEKFKGLINHYEFHLGDPSPAGVSVACATYNDILCISFSKCIEDSIIEREFFRIMSQLGLEVAIECNRGTKNEIL